MSYDESLTVVVNVEAILNPRPLTYFDFDDMEEPLTSSHLVCGKRVLSIPSIKPKRSIEEAENSHQAVNRRDKYFSTSIQNFWSRWRKDYRLALREKNNLTVKRKSIAPIVTGDVVIVESGGMIPRSLWKIGRVEKLRKSRDEEVRGAVARVGREDGSRCCENLLRSCILWR